jgi:hypothetical protein
MGHDARWRESHREDDEVIPIFFYFPFLSPLFSFHCFPYFRPSGASITATILNSDWQFTVLLFDTIAY